MSIRQHHAARAIAKPYQPATRLLWLTFLMSALVLATAQFAKADVRPVPTAKHAKMERFKKPALISIEGQASVSAAPDMGVVTSSVVTPAETAPEALRLNTEAMNKVIAEIKAAGIEDKDIQTSGFSIQPTYKRTKVDESYESEINGYQVRNGVTVRVRDLSKLGDVLTSVVASGSNEVGGISFQISDADTKRDEARKLATEDARKKAEIYAEALGVKVGRVVSVSEGNISIPQPRTMMVGKMLHAEMAPAPIEAGEQSISANVSIIWEIEQ